MSVPTNTKLSLEIPISEVRFPRIDHCTSNWKGQVLQCPFRLWSIHQSVGYLSYTEMFCFKSISRSGTSHLLKGTEPHACPIRMRFWWEFLVTNQSYPCAPNDNSNVYLGRGESTSLALSRIRPCVGDSRGTPSTICTKNVEWISDITSPRGHWTERYGRMNLENITLDHQTARSYRSLKNGSQGKSERGKEIW